MKDEENIKTELHDLVSMYVERLRKLMNAHIKIDPPRYKPKEISEDNIYHMRKVLLHTKEVVDYAVYNDTLPVIAVECRGAVEQINKMRGIISDKKYREKLLKLVSKFSHPSPILLAYEQSSGGVDIDSELRILVQKIFILSGFALMYAEAMMILIGQLDLDERLRKSVSWEVGSICIELSDMKKLPDNRTIQPLIDEELRNNKYEIGETYPVMEIAHSQLDTNIEDMGTKGKFWFWDQKYHRGREWLFKFPRENTGEHWSEKIAYEIARRMNIPAARVELTTCQTSPGRIPYLGTVTLNLANRGDELIHGNEILSDEGINHDSERWWKHNKHTIPRIFSSVDNLGIGKIATLQCKIKLAEYFVFDAVIGNCDRHHENWGILRRRVNNRYKIRIAPTYDHAASLGRELNDTGGKKSRERYLRELGIENYAKHARGAIFIDETDKWGASPLDLVRWCVQSKYKPFFIRALDKAKRLDEDAIREIIARIPPDWMTPLAREFATALICYNLAHLRSFTR